MTHFQKLMNETLLPELKEGEHTVTLKEYTEQNIDTDNPFMRMEYQTTDENKRVIVDNRFEIGFNIMLSHIRKQLGREFEEIKKGEFLKELKEKKIPFKIYISKPVVETSTGRKKVTNIDFLPPYAQEEKAEAKKQTDVETASAKPLPF